MSSARRLVPATATNMAPWVLEALKNGPCERTELLGLVDALARQEGFQVRDVSGLKKALMNLKAAGRVSNVRPGWWRLKEDAKLAEVRIPDDLSLGKRSIPVLREVGQGTEYVYLLQFHDEVTRAKAAGDDAWNCKIGRSRNATQRLLGSVSSTYLVQSPEVGLMIRCDGSANVEAAIHSALKACGRHNKSSPGNEWFFTSPDRVVSFYFDWIKACNGLRIEK